MAFLEYDADVMHAFPSQTQKKPTISVMMMDRDTNPLKKGIVCRVCVYVCMHMLCMGDVTLRSSCFPNALRLRTWRRQQRRYPRIRDQSLGARQHHETAWDSQRRAQRSRGRRRRRLRMEQGYLRRRCRSRRR
jgi:hypothetical protein